MDWVKTSERLPTEDCPVLMSERYRGWDEPSPSGGVLILGIFKDGRFQADRPPDYTVNPEYWAAITIPGESQEER